MIFVKNLAASIFLGILMAGAYAGTTVSSSVDSDGVPISLSQIGKIPTTNYSISADQMISLLK